MGSNPQWMRHCLGRLNEETSLSWMPEKSKPLRRITRKGVQAVRKQSNKVELRAFVRGTRRMCKYHVTTVQKMNQKHTRNCLLQFLLCSLKVHPLRVSRDQRIGYGGCDTGSPMLAWWLGRGTRCGLHRFIPDGGPSGEADSNRVLQPHSLCRPQFD